MSYKIPTALPRISWVKQNKKISLRDAAKTFGENAGRMVKRLTEKPKPVGTGVENLVRGITTGQRERGPRI